MVQLAPSLHKEVPSTVLTEKILRSNPALIKAFTGLPADVFWQLIEDLEAKMPEYERQRHERPDHQRAVGVVSSASRSPSSTGEAEWEILITVRNRTDVSHSSDRSRPIPTKSFAS